MHRLAVALIAEQKDAGSDLQQKISQAVNARLVFATNSLPGRPDDATVRQLRELEPEVVLVYVHPEDPERGLGAIRLLHSALSGMVLCAVGELNQPHTLIRAVREGAIDFIDRTSDASALEATLANLGSEVLRSSRKQGKIVTFLGSKGGVGCTTLAVNTALALQELTGKAVLIDLAPQAHTALHLNVQPSFGISDALANLERMDRRLLEGYMVSCTGGLHLLGGITYPMATQIDVDELVSLFDLLAARYDFIVADCSGRVDNVSRAVSYASAAVFLVVQTSLSSMFSARRIHDFLVWEIGPDRVQFVLNRCRRGSLTDEDVKQAINGDVRWKIPEAADFVTQCVERGTPLVLEKKHEVARAIRQLAAAVAHTDAPHRAADANHEPETVLVK